IYVSDARMELASGYGQYKQSVSIRIDGLDFTFKEHTTDSEAYDFYKSENDFNEDFGSISEFLKGLIIGALENDDNLEKIESQIQESL
ncbi:MAG: hypothetical protein VX253_04370, partial [Bacteroidota bacterium]|nr:hypothetical protein [Bacteroidota bacterium]